MKTRNICLSMLIACLLSSCVQTVDSLKPPALQLPEVSFDTKIAMISLDGFRIQMSARMAKQVAEERGYKIDSRNSDITFDDVINGEPIEGSLRPDIYLKRDNETIILSFDYGRVKGVKHEHMFYQRQQAEELLESYLKSYPEVTLSTETEKYKSYAYKPNRLAIIAIVIQRFGENARRVSLAILDSNYSMSKSNKELRQQYNNEIRRILY